MQNRTGDFVAPGEAGGLAALAGSAGELPENLRLFIADPPGAGAYPIVTFSRLLLHAAYRDEAVCAGVADFVRFGLTDRQRFKAKEEMFERTSSPEAPWYIVEGDDKKRARLNVVHHLLRQVPYAEVPGEPIVLPERVFNPDYDRKVLPDELYVPEVY